MHGTVIVGCYHICPNHSNFQFDTAFMYTIAILAMLKIYQFRSVVCVSVCMCVCLLELIRNLPKNEQVSKGD